MRESRTRGFDSSSQWGWLLSACAILVASCGGSGDGGDTSDGGAALEAKLGPMGGAATHGTRSSHAFKEPAPNLDAEAADKHGAGDKTFEAVFVSEPAPVNAGLGPQFNNDACNKCHVRNGRGRPIIDETGTNSHMLVRISSDDGERVHPGGPRGVGEFGTQIQDQSLYDAEPEANLDLTWETSTGKFGNGETFTLREPNLEVSPRRPDRWPDQFMTSLRQPPPVHGMGLLEAIPRETILEMADPDDADGDGISGRVNRVWDPTRPEGERDDAIGRFGLKANVASLRQQVALAYRDDMGVTSPVFPVEDPARATEVSEQTLRLNTFYVQTLGVPPRQIPEDDDRARRAARGFKTFREIGCADCHRTSLETGSDYPIEALRNQTIHPFTDLLLHDMGEGLADGRPDHEATGREWRTPPLWGIGATGRVQPKANYLHDGRAETLTEAILWHGGEAKSARETFRTMGDEKRDELITFLETL